MKIYVSLFNRFSLLPLIIFLFFITSCKTERSCSGCDRLGNSDYSIEKKMNMKKTARELHNTTLTGTRTKDMEKAENKDFEKVAKKRKKQEENNNKPIL
jgi:hypothetical protein